MVVTSLAEGVEEDGGVESINGAIVVQIGKRGASSEILGEKAKVDAIHLAVAVLVRLRVLGGLGDIIHAEASRSVRAIAVEDAGDGLAAIAGKIEGPQFRPTRSADAVPGGILAAH